MGSRLVDWYWHWRAVVVVSWRPLVEGAELVGGVQMSFLEALASGQVVGLARRLWSARCVVLLWRCIEMVEVGPAEGLGPARRVALLWLC